MAMNPLNVLVVLLVLLCVETSSFGSKNGKQMTMRCVERERKALLLFKQQVANKYDDLGSWKKEEEDCCKYKGVGCDNRTGHVTSLHLSSLILPLSSLNLPYYPYYRNETPVSISDSLLDLPFLNYLDLSSNYIAEIPEFVGSLTNLVHLDFSDTWMEGQSIPYQIGNLSNLQYLNLSFNNFFGVPVPKFISSLHSLRYLDLFHCDFTGVIPHEFGNLSNLQYLDLSYNTNLTRSIPDQIGNLSNLQYLSLGNFLFSFDGLIKPIPKFIGSLNRLRYLDLSNNGLYGVIPREFGNLYKLQHLDLSYNMLEGKIPPPIGHLTTLTHLYLEHNLLFGPIPKSIFNLSNLEVIEFSFNNLTGNLEDLLSGPFPLLQRLWISENQLTGSLPGFTQLSSLRVLDVNSNQLNGYLPTDLQNYSALGSLDLSNNHLKGSLPDFTGFSFLGNLYLHGNEFSGSLPDFTGLTSLSWLDLSNNEFSGSLPDFTGCTSLETLELDENQLTEWKIQSIRLLYNLCDLGLSKNSIRSTITETHLSNLSSLETMNASFNSMTFEFSSKWNPPFQLWELSLASCKLGPNFPNWIQSQRGISLLDISNSQISDTIPFWFWNLSTSFSLLNLSSNKIRGKFSGKYEFIQDIDLSSNHFDGPLPLIPPGCSKINLSQNKFSATLFSLFVAEVLFLSFLDISHNQLFGALPDNWTLFPDLVFLDLGYNNFSGRIPTSIGHLPFLQTLILRKNNLYGKLPASLRNCSKLGFVDFGFNKLSGKVPTWLGEDLPNLYALILKSNRFRGSIPYEVCHSSNLHFLDLSMNKISGNIPPCFGNLTAMIEKGTEEVEHNYVTSSSPSAGGPSTSYSYIDTALARWKGRDFEYGRNFAYLKMIDLSTNKLTGEIPLGITRLLDLKGLNLSGNEFYGQVPLEIGQLTVLECLDLSRNKFSGKIPQSMSKLYSLAYLDISNNNFSGRIPSGTQLQTFDISTYEGNSGLCGKPLPKICPGDEPDKPHVIRPYGEYDIDGEDREYQRGVYISAALGFSTSFWGIIGTLVLNHRWRHAYFLFLYSLKDQLYVAMVVGIAKFKR